jgi:hypothetical protein
MSGTAPPRRKVIPATHDVGLPRSEGEEAPTVAADKYGGMRPLDGKGIDRVARDVIVPTGEGNLFTLEQAFDKGDRFCQPLDPDASRVEVQTCLFVFRLHVSGA